MARGGGIYNAGALELENCTLSYNQIAAGNGGSETQFTAPTAGGMAQGGGIYHDSQTPLLLVNSTIAMNAAIGGAGGLFTQAAFGSSTAGGPAFGGGLFQTNSTAIWTNLAFISNSVVGGTAIGTGVAGAQNGSSISSANTPCALFNTILAFGIGAPNVDIPLDGTNNLSSDNTVFFSPSRNLRNTDPLLGPLRFNGGFTPTAAPLPGSPAIDAGSDLVCPPTDQRGQPRPVGAHCDIGAVEGPGIPPSGPPATASRLMDGRVQFQFPAEPDRVYTLQSSTDLFFWLPIGSANGDRDGMITHLVQPTGSFRFYRVLPNP
jgi:hypothetical protein